MGWSEEWSTQKGKGVPTYQAMTELYHAMIERWKTVIYYDGGYVPKTQEPSQYDLPYQFCKDLYDDVRNHLLDSYFIDYTQSDSNGSFDYGDPMSPIPKINFSTVLTITGLPSSAFIVSPNMVIQRFLYAMYATLNTLKWTYYSRYNESAYRSFRWYGTDDTLHGTWAEMMTNCKLCLSEAWEPQGTSALYASSTRSPYMEDDSYHNYYVLSPSSTGVWYGPSYYAGGDDEHIYGRQQQFSFIPLCNFTLDRYVYGYFDDEMIDGDYGTIEDYNMIQFPYLGNANTSSDYWSQYRRLYDSSLYTPVSDTIESPSQFVFDLWDVATEGTYDKDMGVTLRDEMVFKFDVDSGYEYID